MEETRIIYYVDDEETPYLIKFHSPPEQITLGDFKNALNRPNYKFFFKSLDDDFGVVKEEITDDDAKLPYVNGRVVSWLVVSEGSTQSDNHSSSGKEVLLVDSDKSKDKGTVSDSSDPKSPSFRNYNKVPTKHSSSSKKQEEGSKSHRQNHKFTGPEKITLDETDDAFDEIDSIYNEDKVPPLRKFSDFKHSVKLKKLRNAQGSHSNNSNNNNGTTNNAVKQQPIYESSSSMMSSDLDTTSFFDSEDDSSRFSSATETTMSSKYGKQRRQLRRRRKMPHLSRASSFSSMTDSTVSLNIITVTLNMDTVPFLGISIVGQTNGSQENGDGGIYVGSIMKGGAVALDGRIEPGDMILEVNGISFENVSNEEAVRTLKEQVQKLGPVTLVVAKSWDPNPPGYMLPQQDPVRPIDPRAWVLHTQAMGNMAPPTQPPSSGDQFIQSGKYLPYAGAMSTVAIEVQNPQGKFINRNDESIPSPLTVNHEPAIIIRAMAQADSGLLIRDRLWLKITIYNAFIGSDLVDWLYSHVQGFSDRKEARKFATNLLKMGFIRHTVNKSSFSEQCYYVLNDMTSALSVMNLESEIDSVSVVAGQQQSKARLMHQDPGCKESPILSSGFQSACSNKWSGFNPQSNPGPEMYSQAQILNINNNNNNSNFKYQNFYPDTIQQQSQSLVKPLGLSSNLKPSRGPGSVNSGSGSSASGSSGNVARNISMPVYHIQNQPPVIGSGIVLPDASQYPMHNSPPPSYQQSMSIGTILGKNQSIMTGDSSSNQFSLAISNGILNENSSSGFFSDGVDKCD
uniref:Dishevelled n=1 Tax=Dugesia japonica TaxID=6161 RepID=Q589S6_DUGJA|nr:dishevelled [Dugesia japonica]